MYVTLNPNSTCTYGVLMKGKLLQASNPETSIWQNSFPDTGSFLKLGVKFDTQFASGKLYCVSELIKCQIGASLKRAREACAIGREACALPANFSSSLYNHILF